MCAVDLIIEIKGEMYRIGIEGADVIGIFLFGPSLWYVFHETLRIDPCEYMYTSAAFYESHTNPFSFS